MIFKIDLHVHTKFSGDTNSDPEATVNCAIENGLHGLAFTEHYSYEASEHAETLKEKYKNQILILRGVEFSCAEGHCLIFGINSDRLIPSGSSVKDVLRIVHENGGAVIPSHPYRVSNSIGDLVRSLSGFTAIEGYNGYSHYSQNAKALNAAASMSLPVTGGSDAHESGEVGSCYTEFACHVSEDNFIEALMKGNYSGVDTRKVSRAWIF